MAKHKTIADFRAALIELEWACHDDVSRWCVVCGADWHNEHFDDCAMKTYFMKVRTQFGLLTPVARS